MAKDPAFVFYTGDFLNGVIDMTMEERGQYITLLCFQHQKGHISQKMIDLNMPNVSQTVLDKFKIDDEGKYYNERMEYEIDKRAKFIEHQRENGLKGGRPRKEKTQIKPNENPKETQTIAKKKPLENENDNHNILNNIIDNKLVIDYGLDNNSIYTYIEKNFGRTISPIEFEKISNWNDSELTRYAIDKAVLNNKCSINYIDKILENYKREGIKTLEQAKESDSKFKKSREVVLEEEADEDDYNWLEEE